MDQVSVGSMIKGEGTEEPLGFLTVLNLHWHSAHSTNQQDGGAVKWPQQLRTYLLKHTPPQYRTQMIQTLDDSHTGIIIQSRLINAPPQIIPQLHQCLSDDIAYATKEALWTTATTPAAQQLNQLYRDSFKFKQFILIGRTFTPAATPNATKTKQKNANNHGAIDSSAFVSPFASKKKQQKAAAAAASGSASASSS